MVREKNNQTSHKQELIFKTDQQEYAVVNKALGNCRFEIRCMDEEKVKIGLVRGSMRKRRYVHTNDIVLVSLRDFEENKVDIIHIYNDEDVKSLKYFKELPTVINNNRNGDESIDFTANDNINDNLLIDDI